MINYLECYTCNTLTFKDMAILATNIYKVSYMVKDMSQYLLIIGCSQKKDPSQTLMKALNRYNGVNFKVIKKFKRERKLPENLDIVIISAKYGFLKLDEYIDDYDLRMTKKRAQELHPAILNELEELISNNTYKEIFINLGKDYLPAIEGFEKYVTCPVLYAQGRIGEKLRDMKKWIIRISLLSDDQKTLTDLVLQSE